MGTSKKILQYICLAIIIFIVGMMVRHFYDNYVIEQAPAQDRQATHRVVEPATSLPAPANQDK